MFRTTWKPEGAVEIAGLRFECPLSATYSDLIQGIKRRFEESFFPLRAAAVCPERALYLRALVDSVGSLYPHLPAPDLGVPALDLPLAALADSLADTVFVVLPAKVVAVDAAVEDDNVTPPDGFMKLQSLKEGAHKRKSHVIVAHESFERDFVARSSGGLPPLADIAVAVVPGTGPPVLPAGYNASAKELNAGCGGDSPWILSRPESVFEGMRAFCGGVLAVAIVFGDAPVPPGATLLSANLNSGVTNASPAYLALYRERLTLLQAVTLPLAADVHSWDDLHAMLGMVRVLPIGSGGALAFTRSVETAAAITHITIPDGNVAALSTAALLDAPQIVELSLEFLPSAAPDCPGDAFRARVSSELGLVWVAEGQRRQAKAAESSTRVAGLATLEALDATHAETAALAMSDRGAALTSAMAGALSPMPGLMESAGNTCYMAASVFALFAASRHLDAAVTTTPARLDGDTAASSSAVVALASTLASLVSSIRAGLRVPKSETERLRHALRRAGWESVNHYPEGKAEQQDAAEMLQLLLEACDVPSIALRRRILHDGLPDAADSTVEIERLLQVPITHAPSAEFAAIVAEAMPGVRIAAPPPLPAVDHMLFTTMLENTLDVPIVRTVMLPGDPEPFVVDAAIPNARLQYRIQRGAGATNTLVPVVIKRFANDLSKITARLVVPLAFPAAGVLDPECWPAHASSVLRLMAVVCHSGDKLSSGHYTTFVRPSVAGPMDGAPTTADWMFADDAAAAPRAIGPGLAQGDVDAIECSGYVLFYEIVDGTLPAVAAELAALTAATGWRAALTDALNSAAASAKGIVDAAVGRAEAALLRPAMVAGGIGPDALAVRGVEALADRARAAFDATAAALVRDAEALLDRSEGAV